MSFAIVFLKINPSDENGSMFCIHTKNCDIKIKKKAETFLHHCTDFTQQKNDELFHRFRPIAHEFNLKINTSSSLITPVLACIENSKS